MKFNAQEINRIKVDSGFVSTLKLAERDVSDIECTTKGLEDDEIEFIQKDDILEVVSRQKKRGWSIFRNNDEPRIVKIAVPKDKHFQGIKIESSVGRIEVKNITTSRLKIEGGVGSIFLKNVKVDERLKVEGGAGKFETENCDFTNVKIECGVGLCEVDAKLSGSTEIDGGVGKTSLIIHGKKEDYSIKGESARFFNSIKVDGEDLTKKFKNPEAKNTIKLVSGVGKLEVKFKE